MSGAAPFLRATLGGPAHRAACLALGVALCVGLRLASDRSDLPAAEQAAAEQPAAEPVRETPIRPADRQHWSIRPLVAPEVPVVERASWPRGAIDRFILARLEAKGLAPSPQADRRTLIRRLSLNLTGLPPTPETVEALVRDDSPEASERLVDRLLASPEYAERWAQHWLDLARFAETDGFEHDKLRPDAWKYRDWVIAALAADMPYDRFLALQIAGDQIAPNDAQAKIATAFCLSGPDMPDLNSQQERRHDVLNEITSTVGSVFLALQFGCAQCHDHKYDPISQADFYRLRAFFEPAVSFQRDKSLRYLGDGVDPSIRTHVYLRGDFRQPGPLVDPEFPRWANADGRRVVDSTAAAAGARAALAEWLTGENHPLTARVIVNRVWGWHFGEALCRTPSDFGVIGDGPTHPELLDYLAVELIRSGWSLKHLHRLILSSATYRQASGPAAIATDDPARDAAAAAWSKAAETDPENYLWWRFPRRRLEGETLRDAMLAVSDSLNPRRGGPGVRPPLPEEVRKNLLSGQWDETPDPLEHRRRSIYVFTRRNLRYPLFEAFDRPAADASCARRDRSTTATQSLYLLNSDQVLEAARRLAGAVIAQCEEAASAAGDSVDDGASAGDSPDGAAADAATTAANQDASEAQRRWIDACFRRALGRPADAEEIELGREFLARQAELIGNQRRAAGDLALPLDCPPHVGPHQAAALVDFCLALLNTSEFLYVD